MIYSDLNQYASEISGDRVYGVQAIFQRIDNLISIRKGELLFRMNTGASLEGFLFKPVDEMTALEIYATLADDLRSDSRITIDGSRSRVTPVPDDKSFEIRFVVSVQGLGEHVYQSTFYQNRQS